MTGPGPDDLPELDLADPTDASVRDQASAKQGTMYGDPGSPEQGGAARDDKAQSAPIPEEPRGDLPPALVVATEAQKKGAHLVIAGLTVAERAAKQLLHLGHAQVVVASDGTCTLPETLPAGTLVRELRTSAELGALRTEMQGPVEIAADTVRPRNRDLGISIRVTDERTRRQAEDAIFAELKRGDLGLVARHLNKPLSFWLTRNVLCKQPFTPNQVTLAAGGIGLVGALFVAGGGHAGILFGLLLAHVQSVLDGCDGELARVRFQQSAFGEWLDTIVDDALNLLVFSALAIGLGSVTGSGTVTGLGLFAAACMLFYNVVAYRELLRQGEGGEILKVRWWWSRGKNMKEALSRSGARPLAGKDILFAAGRRDFFLFAWLVLALFGFHRLIALYMLVIGLAMAVAAAGQLAHKIPPERA